ncbi:MAG: DNA-binding protein [Klebsiella michiganensis]|nr:DNA-binding protein [Klebsiella michiganensis]
MTQTPEVSKSHQTGAPSSSAGLLSSSKLTFRQQEVFDLLVAYINQHGYPPTLSELADMLGVSSSNAVLLHLRALERKNFIKLSRRVSRGISIVGRKEPPARVKERLSFYDCSVISHEEKLVFTRATFRG